MGWPGVPLICTCRLQENWAWFFSDMKSLPADLRNLQSENSCLGQQSLWGCLWLSEGSLRHGQLSSHRLSTDRFLEGERAVSSNASFPTLISIWSISPGPGLCLPHKDHRFILECYFFRVNFRVSVLGLWDPSTLPSSWSTAASCKDAPKKPCMKLALSLFSLAAFLRKEM